MRKLIAGIVVLVVVLAVASAQADRASWSGSDSVACGYSSSYWSAPRGAAVFSRAPGMIGAVISSIGENRSHTMLSHGIGENTWATHNTMATPKVKQECDEVVDGEDLANGYPGGSRIPIKAMYLDLFGNPKEATEFLSYQLSPRVTSTSGEFYMGEKIADFFNVMPGAAAYPCTMPQRPGNINAFNAGLNDYYCYYYGGSYCSTAASYANSAGVSVFAPAGTQCSNAAIYNYYCRYYEYYGYGWDYYGYCSQALSYAQSGSCCGGSNNIGCVNVEATTSVKNGGYSYYLYKWPADEDAQHANKYMSYRINEYVNGENGNKNLAGTCSALLGYMQKKALGVGYEATTQVYNNSTQVKPAMINLFNAVNSGCRSSDPSNWWKLPLSSAYCAISCGTIFSNWSDMCERAATQVAYCFTSDVWSDNCKNGCHSSSDVINKVVAQAKALSPDRLAGYYGQNRQWWNGSSYVATPGTCASPYSGMSVWACDTYKGVTWSGGGSVYTCWF